MDSVRPYCIMPGRVAQGGISMGKKGSTRAAAGSGSIRQRPDGRWEARYTYKDELGQTKRGSVYALTQKECRQKLTAILTDIDRNTYTKPQRYTFAQWLDIWLDTYCRDLKPMTLASYKSKIECRIKPAIGGSYLSALSNVQLQKFYNSLSEGDAPLSAKTIQCYHGIIHKSLEQAVAAHVLPANPSEHIKLPKVKKPELKPLMDDNVGLFLEAIRGDKFERLFIVALFSGLRQSELVGLRWDDVDLTNGVLTVCRQIQKAHDKAGYVSIDETKSGKTRQAAVAPSIVRVLTEQKAQQDEWRTAAGSLWNNENNLVFTDERGGHLKHRTIQNHFKAIVAGMGCPNVRFHDLRHSYAVIALQSGDSVKSVQEQLGHYSAAFTLTTYAAVSDTMRRETQNIMEAAFKDATGCKG